MPYRKASFEDMSEIKRIARHVIRHSYTPFLGTDATASFIESGGSDREIEAKINACILLEEKDAIAAFAMMRENLLYLLMVDVPFQNAGYGKALLARAETEMFSRYERLCLQTFKGNSAAIRFYAKHGWQIAGENIVPEMGVTMVQFEKFRFL